MRVAFGGVFGSYKNGIPTRDLLPATNVSLAVECLPGSKRTFGSGAVACSAKKVLESNASLYTFVFSLPKGRRGQTEPAGLEANTKAQTASARQNGDR